MNRSMTKHMFVRTLFGVGLVFAASCAVEAGEAVWRADFTDAAGWEKTKEFGKLVFSPKADSFAVGGKETNKTDTAWQISTVTTPIALKGRYAVCFSLSCKGIVRDGVGSSEGYDSAVFWYDGEGNQIARQPLGYSFTDGPAYDYRFVYDVPEGATQFRIKLGFDAPNFQAGTGVRFSNLRLERAAPDEKLGFERPDIRGPRIRIVSETPTRNVSAPVLVSVTDPSGVDPASVTVKVGDETRTDFTCQTEGDAVIVSIPPVGSTWSEGLHKLRIRASDLNGRVNDATKFFLVGDRPATPAVTLRDDGMTLIGGEPFFPIGIYGVCKRDFNAYDFDRAISDLRAAGFNTVHSYGAARDPAFHAAAAKYGMKMWMSAYTPDADIVAKFRHSPWIIAWYLGDDTAMHATPEEVHDRDDNIRAVDPTRITTQADVLNPSAVPDCYWSYTPATDNFLPEIYPVHGDDGKKDRACVAQTVREMKRIAEDQRENSGGRRHSCWPIIQYFKGWGWKRFPTAEELYGMSFASIIHGAQGITWYTYGGFVNPEKKKFNYGVTSSEEVWRNTTNLTRRLSSLLPVLTERTPARQPVPNVISGPKRDVFGNPSVTALLKVRDGVSYLFAVNASDAPVKAAFSPSAHGTVEVMWENRTVGTDGQGGFSDAFAPLAVHVYRWRQN